MTGRQPPASATFHEATPADAEAIALLVNLAYRPAADARGWTHESDLIDGARTSVPQMLALFQPDSHVLLMRAGELLLACVHVAPSGDSCYIGMLATAPAQQAQGLGKRMLAHAEHFAVTRCGALRLKMSVLSSRPELLAFYERRGYVRTGAREAYPLDAGVGVPKAHAPLLHLLALDKVPG